MKDFKIYKVEFRGMWPVGNTLIIAASNIEQATDIARETITHTEKFEVKEVEINAPCVIEYLSGDY